MTSESIGPDYAHSFQRRHNGPGAAEIRQMLETVDPRYWIAPALGTTGAGGRTSRRHRSGSR